MILGTEFKHIKAINCKDIIEEIHKFEEKRAS